MNFYYVEIRHAEAVESKYLHVVTHLSKKQMYKITQAFVNEKYRVKIRPCEYKATCEYLGYDPFTGLDKFLEKCEQVKLYKVETRPVPTIMHGFLKIDWTDFIDSIAIRNCERKYNHLFVEFVPINKGVKLDEVHLQEYLHVQSGFVWNISCIGHFYTNDLYYDITYAFIDKVTKTLNLQYQYEDLADFELITKEI